MSHILMLTPQVPYPPRQGTALRNWGLLRGLARHHRVALLSFAAPDQSLTPPPPLAERVAQVALLPQPRRHLRDRLRDLVFTSQPDLTQRLASDAFRRQLRAWLDAAPTGAAFDWVLVEGLELAGYLDEVWEREDRPRVAFDAHNCEYLLQKRTAATDRLRPRRWPGALYSAVQWRRLRRYEARVCRRADLVIAVSQADAEALRRIAPSVTPMVVPNGIAVTTYASYTAREPLAQPAFVFTGTMDFRPNVDGVLWFVREVWPRVRAALPAAHFYVVGRRPHPRLDPLRERPDVIVTGAVPDTRPYIGAARVYVVPLLVGGGTRLKLLESTAMGKAVVATRLGAEGFPDREDAMQLADTPATFAQACVRLAQDADARRALEQRARAFAAHYDWEALLPPLVARLSRPPAG